MTTIFFYLKGNGEITNEHTTVLLPLVFSLDTILKR